MTQETVGTIVRRAAALDLLPHRGLILGLDVGGTKLAAGVLDGSGRLLSWERTPTPVDEGPDAVIARLTALGHAAIDATGLRHDAIAAIGIGCGGPLDPAEGVVLGPMNLPGWEHVPLAAELERAFGVPACLDNDANAAALGELAFGAGRGCEDLVFITISTGIGGGVVAGGRLLRGRGGNAAELGHLSIDMNGRECVCGGRGCLEAYASGTAIARRAREALSHGEPSLLPVLAGGIDDLVTSETVVAAVRAGDRLARRIWDETIAALGAGIASAIHAFNPQVVVLGGGVTGSGDLLLEPLRREVQRRTMPQLVTPIVAAELGERLGVYGAAAVAGERLGVGPWAPPATEDDEPDAEGAIEIASFPAAISITSPSIDAVDEHLAVVSTVRRELLPAIDALAELLIAGLARGGRLIAFGNGGSAADAQHFVAELIGHYRADRPPLPAIALTVDSSVLTCIANDYGYADVFARQVEALAGSDDVVFGISTSGEAPNVVRGLLAARLRGATTVALTGGSGGAAARIASHALVVPSTTTARIQEMHTLVVHLLSERVDEWACGRAAEPGGPPWASVAARRVEDGFAPAGVGASRAESDPPADRQAASPNSTGVVSIATHGRRRRLHRTHRVSE